MFATVTTLRYIMLLVKSRSLLPLKLVGHTAFKVQRSRRSLEARSELVETLSLDLVGQIYGRSLILR